MLMGFLAACRGGNHSTSSAGGGPVPIAPSPPSPVPMGEGQPHGADLTGQYDNVMAMQFADKSEDGTLSGEQSFAVNLPGPGTLLLLGTRLLSESCDGAFGQERLVLREIGKGGQTTALHALETYVPLRFQGPKTFVLEVFATAQAACAARSPVTLKFALRFFPIEITSISQTGAADDQPRGPGGPVVPGSPGNTEPPGTTPPNPPPLPVPAPCLPLATSSPADLPVALRGGVVFYGTNSRRDGCQELFRWKVAEIIQLEPFEHCAVPTVSVERTGRAGQETLVKISEKHADYALNLSWLLGPDPKAATWLAGEVAAGHFAAVTATGDGCAKGVPGQSGAAPVMPLSLNNDSDWTIFRGDAREKCVGDPTSATTVDEALDPQGAAAGLSVDYRYSKGLPAEYYWHLNYTFRNSTELVAAAKGTDQKAQLNLYNHRTHSYIGHWQDLALSSLAKGDVTITDPPTLVRLLPYQGDMDVVLRVVPTATVGDQIAVCGPLFVYGYGREFLDVNRVTAIRDLTSPERSRFLLKEQDLPAPP